MRSRLQVAQDMVTAARPSEPDKYELRLLKAELLTVELLLDIRDLLTHDHVEHGKEEVVND